MYKKNRHQNYTLLTLVGEKRSANPIYLMYSPSHHDNHCSLCRLQLAGGPGGHPVPGVERAAPRHVRGGRGGGCGQAAGAPEQRLADVARVGGGGRGGGAEPAGAAPGEEVPAAAQDRQVHTQADTARARQPENLQ